MSISSQTLAWLRQSAALDGAVVSQTLLNLLERVEALEQESTCKQSLQVPPTPEPAPVVTDGQILAMRSWSSHGPTFDSDLVGFGRALYDLGRQHGAAQPPAAQPTPPAPEPGEVGELVAELEQDGKYLIASGYAKESIKTRNLGMRVIRPATPLQQLSSPAPVAREVAIPGEQWHDDDGACLWWRFPIEEPPWSGDPRGEDWPGYHTHFTRIVCPVLPQAGEVEG